MCYSIIRVTFKDSKEIERKDCESEAEERVKISEAKDKPQVLRVSVFRCQRHVVRTERWEEQPYNPPVLDGDNK